MTKEHEANKGAYCQVIPVLDKLVIKNTTINITIKLWKKLYAHFRMQTRWVLVINALILWIWSEHKINNKEVVGPGDLFSNLIGILFPFLVWLQVKEFSGFIIVVKPMSS